METQFPFRSEDNPLTGKEFRIETRRALAAAREEAQRLGYHSVEVEHVLLAIMREDFEEGQRPFGKVKLEAAVIYERLVNYLRHSHPHASTRQNHKSKAPYSASTKRFIRAAMDEARNLGDAHVGTEHLLLAVLANPNNVAGRVLCSFGITHGDFQQTMRSASSDGRPLKLRIRDDSNLSIYEQIISHIREAVATDHLRPGDRLPTVRRLADDLDVAPGTVARAFMELERLGVVITDGTRGTRIAKPPQSNDSLSKCPEVLVGLLRTAAVSAFHLGATKAELRHAFDTAMIDIFSQDA